MATLEKIRSKSVLLFVIIILALLAFILGDFITSGRTYFGSGTTVAKAGGVSVGYTEYQNRISQLSEQARSRNTSSDYVSAQALNDLLSEGLMNKEYKALGITVTNNELTEAMIGANQHPAAMQAIGQLSGYLGLAVPDAAAVHDAITNPTRYNLGQAEAAQIAQYWTSVEDAIEADMLAAKYNRLITGLFTYNNLDAQSLYDNIATTRRVAYAGKASSTVPDSVVTVSDADVRAYYNAHKNEYRLNEPSRLVRYIMVPLAPSQDDRIAADQTVETALMGIDGVEGMEAIANDSRFITQNISNATYDRISNPALKSFIDTAVVNQAVVIDRTADEYVLAKLNGTSMGIDSINISMVQAMNAESLDSIASAMAAGATAESFNGDLAGGTDDVWQSLLNPTIPEVIVNALTNGAIGTPFTVADSVAGYYVFKINERRKPVKTYDISVVNFAVDPSQETLNQLSTDLRSYTSNNSSAVEFANQETAFNAGYLVQTGHLTPSSVNIAGNVPDSREFVKWAFDASKGQVSPVFQDNKGTYLIALALEDKYNDYVPYNSPEIYPELERQALSAKRASHLMNTYGGQAEDVAGYAALMEVAQAEMDANITRPLMLFAGVDNSKLAGAIAAAADGEFVGPVEGDGGILVFQVKSTNTANQPFDTAEYGTRFMRNFCPISTQGVQGMMLLLGSDKVTNNSLNFVHNPANN